MSNIENVKDDLRAWYQPTTEATQRKRALESLAIIYEALKEKAERDNPQPLTLEQLRERENKPVYLTFPTGEDVEGWDILTGISMYAGSEVATFTEEEFLHLCAYGTYWIAYDHPPKDKLEEST